MHFTWVLSEMCKPDVPPEEGGGEKEITADSEKDRESEKIKDVWRGKQYFTVLLQQLKEQISTAHL